jgi:hypothetical protein
LIESLIISLSDVKQEWLADDSAVNGKVESLYNWYKHLNLEGKKFGFLVNGSKSWQKVKSQEKNVKKKSRFGKTKLKPLLKLQSGSHMQPYITFSEGYRSKLTFFVPTIESFEVYVEAIQEVRNEIFLPTIFRQDYLLPHFPDELKEPFTLSPTKGGLER